MKRLLSLVLLQAAFLAGGEKNPIEELDRFVAEAMKEWKVPGVAVSVVKGGEVLLNKGYGIANVETGAAVDNKTIFQLASITKCFTAAAMGIQVEQGKLSWDQPVLDHLPQFVLKDPYPSRYCTARDLLAHRTGLPAFGGDLLGRLGYTNEELLWRIRYIEPAGSFRARSCYSNVGFFAAGELSAAIAKRPWEQLVKETLLDPLKMERSGFAANLDRGNAGYGHILLNGKAKMVPWDRTGGFPAAGALSSTSTDMAAWMSMLLAGGTYQGRQLLKPETVQEMFASSMVGGIAFSEAAPIDEYSGFNYGLGWANYHYRGKMIVEKGGGLDGIRTVTTLIPEEGLGITVLCNLNLTLLPEAIRAKFLELYLGGDGAAMQSKIKQQGEALLALIKPEEPPAKPLPLSRPLESFTGSYENELYGTFVLTAKEGKLLVDAGPAPFKGEMAHVSGDEFLLTWSVVNSGGDAVLFTFDGEGKPVSFQCVLGTFNALLVSH